MAAGPWRDTAMRAASPGAAGLRVCCRLPGAAPTTYGSRCVGASGLARRLGAGAVQRGDRAAMPQRGAAAASTPARGLLGESLNPPSLLWLDGGCLEALISELSPSVVFPVLPV